MSKGSQVLKPVNEEKYDEIWNQSHWIPAVFAEIKIDKHCSLITSGDRWNVGFPLSGNALHVCHCISFAALKVYFCHFWYLRDPWARWFNIAFALYQRLCGIELQTRTLYSHWIPWSRVMCEKLIVENSAISQKNGIRSVVATNTSKLAD